MAAGPGDILQLIREGRVATRRDITEATGLSRVTVAQRIDALRRTGLIYEAEPEESTGGRRPTRLRVNHDHGLVLTAVVDTTHVELSVTNLAGEALVVDHRAVTTARGPRPVLDEVLAGFAHLIDAAGKTHDDIDGIGVSLPAPIDPQTMRPSSPPLMPGWDDYDMVTHLGRVHDVPIVVENDANVTALGEQSSHHPDASPLCLIKVSTGIGCGFVVGGDVLTGVDGGSGDIGHIRLDGHEDAVCTCGSRGCLAAVASGGAIAAQLTAIGHQASSGSDVRRLLEAGDVQAIQLTREAGRRIGRVASIVNSVVNPEVLVVTGDLASDPLLAGIQESIYEYSLPRAIRNLQVVLGGLGDRAAQMGLSHLVANKVFDPAAVDLRVGSA